MCVGSLEYYGSVKTWIAKHLFFLTNLRDSLASIRGCGWMTRVKELCSSKQSTYLNH